MHVNLQLWLYGNKLFCVLTLTRLGGFTQPELLLQGTYVFFNLESHTQTSQLWQNDICAFSTPSHTIMCLLPHLISVKVSLSIPIHRASKVLPASILTISCNLDFTPQYGVSQDLQQRIILPDMVCNSRCAYAYAWSNAVLGRYM